MLKLSKLLIIGLLTLIGAACTSAQHYESTGEYIDSSAITMKVKASLLDQLGSSGFEVKVKTYKDEVQLSGFVDSITIKQRAARIASGVNGVRSVRNNLLIKPR